MVREACQGRQSCVLQATAGNASEPCPRVSKYLVLNYECKPSKLTNLHFLGLHAEDISYLHVLISGLIHAAMEQINFCVAAYIGNFVNTHRTPTTYISMESL